MTNHYDEISEESVHYLKSELQRAAECEKEKDLKVKYKIAGEKWKIFEQKAYDLEIENKALKDKAQGLADAINYYIKDLEPSQYRVCSNDSGFLLDLYDFLGTLRKALAAFNSDETEGKP